MVVTRKSLKTGGGAWDRPSSPAPKPAPSPAPKPAPSPVPTVTRTIPTNTPISQRTAWDQPAVVYTAPVSTNTPVLQRTARDSPSTPVPTYVPVPQKPAWDQAPSIPPAPIVVVPPAPPKPVFKISSTPWDSLTNNGKNINLSTSQGPWDRTSEKTSAVPNTATGGNIVSGNQSSSTTSPAPASIAPTNINAVESFNFGDTFKNAPELQQVISFNKEFANQEKSFAERWSIQDQKLNDLLSNVNVDTAKNIDTINRGRVNAVTQSFTTINSAVEDLLNKSKNLFDMSETVREANLANSLANQGYINQADVGQTVSYQMADYRRGAQLKQAEIEQQVTEKKVEIEQNKLQVLDAISKDTLTSAEYKQKLQVEVIQAYSETNNQLDEKLGSFRKIYADTVNSSINAVAQGNLNLKLAQQGAINDANATRDVDNMLLAKALTSRSKNPSRDNDRYNYVLSKVPPELQVFASQAITSIPNFYERSDFPNVISEVMKRASESAKLYSK